MSTSYIIAKRLDQGKSLVRCDLDIVTFENALVDLDLRVAKRDGSNLCLVDEDGNALWIEVVDDAVVGFDRYGANQVEMMLGRLEGALKFEAISEHEEAYVILMEEGCDEPAPSCSCSRGGNAATCECREGCDLPPIVLSKHEAIVMVQQLLMGRQGEVIDAKLAKERAANIITALAGHSVEA